MHRHVPIQIIMHDANCALRDSTWPIQYLLRSASMRLIDDLVGVAAFVVGADGVVFAATREDGGELSKGQAGRQDGRKREYDTHEAC